MKKILLTLLLLSPLAAHAHPVPYAKATGVMTWNQSFLSDDWVTYSFRPDMAIAARHMRAEMPDGRMHFYAPQYDLLIKRWNQTDSQANIYAYGAYGPMKFKGNTVGAGLAGVEADAESRKLFIMGKYEKMWSRDISGFYTTTARIGAAPYEAEFNEIAAWLMLQYQYHPRLTKKQAWTPLVRLFYRSVLVESGVSTDGDWMLNFMFHF